jgi:hypothetical protein
MLVWINLLRHDTELETSCPGLLPFYQSPDLQVRIRSLTEHRTVLDAHIPLLRAQAEAPLRLPLSVADVYRRHLQPEHPANIARVLVYSIDVEPIIQALFPLFSGAETVHVFGCAVLNLYDVMGPCPLHQVKQLVQIMIQALAPCGTFNRSLISSIDALLLLSGDEDVLFPSDNWPMQFLVRMLKVMLLGNYPAGEGEQLSCIPLATRADVYSWGSTALSEFLAGNPATAGALILHAVAKCAAVHTGVSAMKTDWAEDCSRTEALVHKIAARLLSTGSAASTERIALSVAADPPDVFAALTTLVFQTKLFRSAKIDVRTIPPHVIRAVEEWDGEFRLGGTTAYGGDAASLKALVATHIPRSELPAFAMYVRLIDRTRHLRVVPVTAQLHTHYTITHRIKFPDDAGPGRMCVYVCLFCSSINVRPAAVQAPKSYIPVIVCAPHIRQGGVICGKCHSTRLRLVDLSRFIIYGDRFNITTNTECIGLCGDCLQTTIVVPSYIVGIAPMCVNCFAAYAQCHHPWSTGPFSYAYKPMLDQKCCCYMGHVIFGCCTSTTVLSRPIVDTAAGRVRMVATCAYHRFAAFVPPVRDQSITDAQFCALYVMKTRSALPYVVYNS